jgi:AcrR family transcriptional regulator
MAQDAAPARRRRKDDRPGEIITAALALFAERGFGTTRLDDVAARAGISKATIYLYFPTKEDLFRAVVRQELIPLLLHLEALVATHTGGSAALLRLIFLQLAAMAGTAASGIPKLVLAEAGNFPEIARFYADEVTSRGRALFERVIARGVAEGAFRPVDAALLPPILMGPLLAMVLWRHSIGRHVEPSFDPRAVIDLHLDLLLRGLAPETPS